MRSAYLRPPNASPRSRISPLPPVALAATFTASARAQRGDDAPTEAMVTGKILDDGSWQKGPIVRGNTWWETIRDLNNVFIVAGDRLGGQRGGN